MVIEPQAFVFVCIGVCSLQNSRGVLKEPDCAVFLSVCLESVLNHALNIFLSGDAEKRGLHMSGADNVLVIYEETYRV